jgi:hypothetical protein
MAKKKQQDKATTHACSRCGKGGAGKKGRGDSLQRPSGWKEHAGRTICAACVKATFRLRAVAFPVAGVVEGGTWEEFRAALRDAFRASTDLHNWAVRQLLARDAFRLPGQAEFPPCPKVDLYKLYNDLGCPLGDVPGLTRATIFQTVQSDYLRRRRIPCLAMGRENLPLKRYPAPVPVHNQAWRAEWREVGGRPRPCVSFRLHGVATEGAPRWVVQLPDGKPFARQLGDFRAILDGETILGQLDLYEQPCGQTDHNRATSATRRTSGGANQARRLMVKLVARFPVRERPPASGVLALRTDPEAFWVAEHDGRVVRPWILNADEFVRWCGEMRALHDAHARWLQRMREDTKLERRLDGSRLAQLNDAYRKRCDKHRRRVKTWIDQTVAQVVNYCGRQRVAGLIYDDENRAWLDSFPWHQVRTTLRQRCERDGIVPGGTLTLPETEPEGDAVGGTEGG